MSNSPLDDDMELDKLCSMLVGAATLYEKEHEKVDGLAIEEYIKRIKAWAAKQAVEARKSELEDLWLLCNEDCETCKGNLETREERLSTLQQGESNETN